MADRGVNQVTLLGRLACEPDEKQTAGGVPYCWLKLAVNTERPGRSGESKVEYVRCVFFNSAGTLPYLHTGRQVHIQGRLESYQKDKDSRMEMNVQVDRLILTDNKPAEASESETMDHEAYIAELQDANEQLRLELGRLQRDLEKRSAVSTPASAKYQAAREAWIAKHGEDPELGPDEEPAPAKKTAPAPKGAATAQKRAETKRTVPGKGKRS